MLRSHLYASLLSMTGVLVLIGAYLVSSQAPVGSVQSDNWGNGVIVHANPISDVIGDTNQVSPTLSGKDYAYTSPFSKNAQSSQQAQDGSSDWNALQKALSKPVVPTKTITTDPPVDAYAFIPSGLVTPTTPSEPTSEADRELYEYGNGIGTAILAYEGEHANQAAILTNFAQDRTSAEKQAAMKKLGSDLAAVGDAIDAIEPAPAAMGTTAHALADSYREIGAKLALIPDAKTDDALVKAMLTYNASAENFVGKYVAVAMLFQAHGITFGKDEPGSVFMLPNTGN